MFTGLIEAVGTVGNISRRGKDMRLEISGGSFNETNIGDSIAVNGVCLTVVKLVAGGFSADVSLETLAKTTLGKLKPGAKVNLERALTPASLIGGHIVSGHVDGLAEVVERKADGNSIYFKLKAPVNFARYIAGKGSVCIDGVSLTVNAVDGVFFSLNIVPHTLNVTIVNEYRVGSLVNLEIDLVARYIERLLAANQEPSEHKEITERFLRSNGF